MSSIYHSRSSVCTVSVCVVEHSCCTGPYHMVVVVCVKRCVPSKFTRYARVRVVRLVAIIARGASLWSKAKQSRVVRRTWTGNRAEMQGMSGGVYYCLLCHVVVFGLHYAQARRLLGREVAARFLSRGRTHAHTCEHHFLLLLQNAVNTTVRFEEQELLL